MCEVPRSVALGHLAALSFRSDSRTRVRLCEDASLADAHAAAATIAASDAPARRKHPPKRPRLGTRHRCPGPGAPPPRTRSSSPSWGLRRSCAAMSLSFSSELGYLLSASEVRSASISRTAISRVAAEHLSLCAPLPLGQRAEETAHHRVALERAPASSGSSLGSSGSHRMKLVLQELLGVAVQAKREGLHRGVRCREAPPPSPPPSDPRVHPEHEFVPSSGFSPTCGAKPYEMSSSELGRVP